MGYIYKVTCLVNNKVYVGLTNISVQNRWNTHIGVSYNPNSPDYNFAFHRAIRKYGVDNFIVEQIDEGSGEELKEKEKYWIDYYDSYNKGYNCTLGGDGQCKYDYDEIIEYYLNNNNSITETCKEFGIYDQVVYCALQSRNINYKKLPKQIEKRKVYNKRIHLIELDLYFDNMKQVDDYFKKQAHPNVRRCLNGITEKAYGYHWEEVE